MKSAIRNPQSAISTAFTLIEMMVVIAIIILIVATALPTLTSLFTAGQDSQAINVFSAQLSAARALAITQGTYAGVHIQMADAKDEDDDLIHPDLEGKCYTAIVIYDRTLETFVAAPGYQPIPMPGTMAFGKITVDFIDSSHDDEYDGLDSSSATTRNENLHNFTTFTIVFNPQGEVVMNVEGAAQITIGNDVQLDGSDIDFSKSRILFWEDRNNSTQQAQLDPVALWELPQNFLPTNQQKGVLALTLFDYKVLKARLDARTAEAYLDEFGQFMALNLYTGKFFTRE